MDRWKDMSISGGENVYPPEAESVTYQIPQIGEVAITGIPDENGLKLVERSWSWEKARN